MSNLTNIPLQDDYETTLTQELAASVSALTIYVNTVPSFTFPSGVQTRAVLNPGKSNMEVVKISAWDSSAKTLTIPSGGRAQSLYNGHTASVQTHNPGNTILISDNFAFWDDIRTSIITKLDTDADDTIAADTTFSITTKVGLIVNSLTEAQRNALSSAPNGGIIYNTTAGQLEYRKAGSWVTFDVGTPPVNAADHTAGILDVASATEMQAGTATDATSGALNAVVVGNTTETSAGAGDYGKVPRLGSGGRLDNTVHNQTLVGGLVSNADTLHTHAQFPEEYTFGENIDGSTTPQAALIASGSFSLTAGRVYKSSSILIGRGDFAGFVKENISSGNTGKLYNGIVSGFTGLTQGAYYYVTNTSGSIQAGFYPFTQNKNKVCVGQAVSATEIDTRKVPLPRFNIGMPEAIQVTLSDLTQSVSGSGATSVRETGILFTSGATNNSDAIRYSAATLNMGANRYDFGYDHILSFSFRCSASTDQDIFMGFHSNQETTINADATDTDDHIGVYIQDGTLYMSNAGGATQTRTSVAATLTNVNLIRIETDRVTGSIAFYLNDSLAAYHTTNTPSSSSMFFVFGVTNRNTADKQLALFAPVHWGHAHY